jgi:formylmethanofuran dehydrogenase subunit E
MKSKEYEYKNITQFKDDPDITQKLQDLELNFCDKCGIIEVTTDLFWNNDGALCNNCNKEN